MSDKAHESLSALMDNEAEELELRRILKQMPDDAALEAKWSRYHLVRSVARQEMYSLPSRNLLSSIRNEIDKDPLPQAAMAEQASAGTSLWGYLGRGAVAATVTISVLLGVNYLDNEPSQLPSLASSSSTPLNDYNPSEFSRMASYTESNNAFQQDQAAQERLRRAVYQQLEGASQTDGIPVVYVLPE